jgi:hypothetical protein
MPLSFKPNYSSILFQVIIPKVFRESFSRRLKVVLFHVIGVDHRTAVLTTGWPASPNGEYRKRIFVTY